ncbi:MAG TPA: sodium:glutamate symporter [Firmicutes bacterium]|nr:sodium:glutamate symporter [Bacillota bacterium]
MNQNWNLILDLVFLSLLIGLATLLKRLIKPLNKFLIPNAVLAGLIGLVVGPNLLNAIPFDYLRLQDVIYHLMALGFIAIALKKKRRKSGATSFNTGMFVAASYGLQGIFGLILGLILAGTIFKGLFPPFGFMLALGFAQGPGQALSMGSSWEPLGFVNGAQVGLSFSTMGFLWAAFIGVLLLNLMVYRKKQIGIPIKKPEVVRMIDVTFKDHESSDIDSFTIQAMCVGIVYLVTFFFLKWFSGFINQFGSFAQTVAQMLWGFHFVFGAIFGFIFRFIYDKIRKERKYTEMEYLNDFHLQRIAGGIFDFMVAASIAAISIQLIKEYLLPLIIVSTLGGIFIIGYVIYISKRIYSKHVLEHIVAMFGMHTGTISTGIALLRELDPQFESGTAEDLVLGSGVAIFVGAPMMIIISFPIEGYKTGNPNLYYLGIGLLLLYLLILYFAWFLPTKKKIARENSVKSGD